MKKLIILFLLIFCVEGYSQWPKYRFTSGFKDKNPVFASKYNTSNNSFFSWEFLAFERWSGTNSQICVLRIGQNGPIDTVKYLTNTATQKRNPSISYIAINGYPISRVPCALAIWEEYSGSKWNLYASSYDTLTGWTPPYAFDTSAGNKSGVKIYGNTIPSFMIAYEKNNDIIFRQFNSQTKQITYDTNLTVSDTSLCSNPYLSNGLYTYLAYEKVKSDGKKAIYFRHKTAATTWTAPDTAAYLGNNTISEFGCGSFLYPEVIFSSDRTGKNKLYSTQIFPVSQLSQTLLFLNQNNYYNYSTMRTFLFPIITDSPTWQVFAYIRKSDSTKMMCGNTGGTIGDSTTLGDTSLMIKPSMNLGVINGSMVIIWIAYTKDSLSFSNIYAKRNYIFLGNIKKIGSTIPEKFELMQNFPNPFNPSTNIRYKIANSSYVKLKIYNALGKEVITLVNENQFPGTYEVQFSAGNSGTYNISSGVYYYKLETEGKYNFSEVKKMVLMK